MLPLATFAANSNAMRFHPEHIPATHGPDEAMPRAVSRAWLLLSTSVKFTEAIVPVVMVRLANVPVPCSRVVPLATKPKPAALPKHGLPTLVEVTPPSQSIDPTMVIVLFVMRVIVPNEPGLPPSTI